MKGVFYMLYLFLAALASGCAVGQSALNKSALHKTGSSGVMGYNFLRNAAALVCFFVIFMGAITFHTPTLIYSAFYSVFFFCSAWFGCLALMSGSMALTSTLVSYYIVIPAAFGIIFLKEEINIYKICGFILLLLSIYLLSAKGDKREKAKSKLWLPCVILTFLCNGFGSIVQKLHQVAYPGAFCNEFTLYSVAFMCIMFLVVSLFKKEKTTAKSLKYAAPSGFLGGANSYLMLALSAKVNASVLFPVTTVFHMVFNILTSRLLFKDKLTLLQIAGICVGILSVILIK